MKKKKWLAMLVAVVMVCMMLPMTALAAGTVSVQIGSTTLNDGANSIGGGTATLDAAQNTLTLENVSTTNWLGITSDNEFTVIVKGINSIGNAQSRTNGTALWSTTTPALNIKIESGAELALYTDGGNSIYVNSGSVNISGPGKLTADTVGGYPALCVENGNLNLKDSLQANITSDGHGLFAYKGNIDVENATLTVTADRVGLFAEIYDHDTDDDIPSAVALKNSTVTLNTEDHGVFCGSGGILVENTLLTTTANKDIDNFEGYSLYADGDITIKGSSEIKADDGYGIAADGGVLRIEGGEIDVSSTDIALFGRKGVSISGGTIKALSEEYVAIQATKNNITITGENTKVTATSNNSECAAIRTVDGVIDIDADITATNSAGGRPIQGEKKDNSLAITLGDGVEASNINGSAVSVAKVYDEEKEKYCSYFILADGESADAVTDTIKTCKHVWGEPTWTWNQDHTSATAEFVCTKDTAHTRKVAGTIGKETTEATCAEAGKTVYTARIEFNGKSYTDTKTVDIPATGKHSFKDGKCTVCGVADPSVQPDEDPEPTDKPTTDVPKTGEDNSIMLWGMVLLVAGAGIVGVILYGRKKASKR